MRFTNRDFPFGWIFSLVTLAFSIWLLTQAVDNLVQFNETLEVVQNG